MLLTADPISHSEEMARLHVTEPFDLQELKADC